MIKVSVIGLGLIGGSIAKALKSTGKQYFVSAYDPTDSVNIAFKEGVVDQRLANIGESVNADVIFVCAPFDSTLEILKQLAPKVKNGTIVTDVSGVKLPLQKAWSSFKSEGIYIGGHPMTGKEKGGYENSDPLLFENAVYILDVAFKNSSKIEPLTKIIADLGSQIAFLEPRIHDMMIAYVSHLPQLLAVALTNLAAFKEEEISFLDFAAGGFKDLTRIASSPFEIWKPVFKANKKEITNALEAFQIGLEKIKKQIEKEEFEQLEKEFLKAIRNRNEIPKSNKGFLTRLYDVFVFVKDEPGVISKISTVLFENNINIKDIELLKIREGRGGTFRLAFDSYEDSKRASEILTSLGFKIS